MYLIADSWINNWTNWILMGFSIGLIIFVHEMGHFLVAKACGVKCEKFYLGFDIFGLKIVHFQWGETEYGIGALPLGGYVKMLGQDDNPGRAAEEAERTKKKQSSVQVDVEEITDDDEKTVKTTVRESTVEVTEKDKTESPSEDDYELDPRSYTAKTVPQRMAIISAGVIMNVIFAFVFATTAHALGLIDPDWGVHYVPCKVSALAPGGEAWTKNVQVGDHNIKYGDKVNPSAMEMRKKTVASDTENGIEVVSIRTDREGNEREITQGLYPQMLADFRSIGVHMGYSTTINGVLEDWPAGRAPAEFQKGDKIVAVNGEKVLNYGHLHESLARDPTQPVKITVERANDDDPSQSEELTIVVASNPMRRLGVVMEMGKIVAVQEDSPAAKAGLKADDFIERIKFDVKAGEQPDDMSNVNAGSPPGDPITLPERLRVEGAKVDPQERVIFISVDRNGEKLNLKVELRPSTSYQSAYAPGHPISESSLGIAYRVVNRVAGVVDGYDLKLQKGDVLVSAKFIPAEERHDDEKKRGGDSLVPYEFAQSKEDRSDSEKIGWPAFMQRLQLSLDDTTVELTFNRKVGENTEQKTVTITPYDSEKWYVPERGLRMKLTQLPREVYSFGDAMAYGYTETVGALTMVYDTLKMLFSGDLSPKHLGGMGTIFAMAGSQADRGMADLLLFMTLISANLAIINFLPIPVLDGGHMVILTAEAIRRKPVSERILLPITYAGLIFILGLFLFVTYRDGVRGWGWLMDTLS